MSGDTIITLVGNLVDDPSLRFTPGGKPVAKSWSPVMRARAEQ